jgi:hypothetical protein
VFGNRVVRRLFGPKRDEVTGVRRKEEHLQNYYDYQVKKNKMLRSRSTHDKYEKCIQNFSWKT